MLRRLGRLVRRGRPGPVSTPPEGWVAALRSARWLDTGHYEVTGWALVRGVDPVPPTVVVPDLPVTAEPVADPDLLRDVDVVAGDPDRDLRPACFRAVVDLGPALAAAARLDPGEVGAPYPVTVRVGTAEGPLLQVFRDGSAGRLRRQVQGGLQVEPRWDAATGLGFVVRRPWVLAADLGLDGRGVLLPAGTLGRAAWERDGTPVLATVATDGDTLVVSPPAADGGAARWTLRSLDRTATGDAVRLGSGADPVLTAGSTTVVLTPTGVVTVRSAPAVPVDEVEVDGDRLVVGGPRVDPTGPAPRLVLSGHRASILLTTTSTAQRWSAVAVLAQDGLTVPPDVYALGTDPTGVGPLLCTADVVPVLGRWVLGDLLRARPERAGAGLRLRVRPPVDPRTWGRWARAETEAREATAPDRPVDAVYLESFSGRRVADNPLALRHALARSRPELRRVWGVADGSVAVPPGDDRVILGTAAWREIRSTARLLVTNDWLHGPAPRPFQRVVQTWHGTPLKRLALDRGDRDATFVADLRREVAGWDLLVSQSPYMTGVLRRAYGFTGEVVESGYPRNDGLAADADRVRDEVRAELGIEPTARVLLYAPTWRDDDRSPTRLLDLPALAERLGPGWTLLVRGHTETLAHPDVSAGRIVDVTLRPVVEELFAAADVLVTDYSSVMFDFAVTGRPLVFFVPDLAAYGDSRGCYFDLAAEAPGPLVDSLDGLVAALGEDLSRWAAPYAAWRERYVPHDDGGATARVLARVLDRLSVGGRETTS